ncbi:helix-turn-helix domain-containing protein [Reichenbachiella ulvae]|uniref:Helix-turn-helix domain-containing protein n=1 Tax=Reichenbachiella ulvae TaxID=2980104 RepID=A0ABT3CXJ0_9BACT|nr:helix-turn-helix domain-containing protein [Reichenbachiella ulvae]MCV9388249.1 helix-turn-helix domain-containing protein [Reichenbachiella ulvae]
MLKLKIDHVAQLRGIRRTYSYLTKLGMSHGIAQRLSSGNVKNIHLKHLENLCKTLRCTPNDILDWQGEDLDREHPLLELRKDPKALKSLEKLRQMPLDKLEKLGQFLDEMD